MIKKLLNIFIRKCPNCSSTNIIKMNTRKPLLDTKVIMWGCCDCCHEWKTN